MTKQDAVQATAETMPAYECHRIIKALQIKTVSQNPTDSALTRRTTLTFVDERFAPLILEPEVTAGYVPVQGDYYVVYQNGSQGFLPAAACEMDYVMVPGQSAGQAAGFSLGRAKP